MDEYPKSWLVRAYNSVVPGIKNLVSDFFFEATGGVQDSYWIYIKTKEKSLYNSNFRKQKKERKKSKLKLGSTKGTYPFF